MTRYRDESVLADYRRSRVKPPELPRHIYKALRAAYVHQGRIKEFKETLGMAGLVALELEVKQYVWFKNKKGFSDVDIDRFLKKR